MLHQQFIMVFICVVAKFPIVKKNANYSIRSLLTCKNSAMSVQLIYIVWMSLYFPGFDLSRPDEEEKLTEDYELQAWGLELVADGNPGCGIKVTRKVKFSKISLLPFAWCKLAALSK